MRILCILRSLCFLLFKNGSNRSLIHFRLAGGKGAEYDAEAGDSSESPAPALVRQIPTVRFVLAIWLSWPLPPSGGSSFPSSAGSYWFRA